MQPPKPHASWILNQTLWIAGSLVLRGPRSHSYCLLWFICRCTWLFDVSSREASHLLEKWGGSELWNKTWICQNGSDRWICGFLACRHVWFCVHSEVTVFCFLFLSENPRFAQVSVGIHSDSYIFSYINYALKIWLEQSVFIRENLGSNHRSKKKCFFFPVYSFANLNSCRGPPHLPIPRWCFSFFIHLF